MSNGGQYMARALQLARLGSLSSFPNPRVGCVIVRDGRVIGEGWHQRAGGPHAEVFALRSAGEAARGADVYVTLEPCAHHGRTPPCAEALVQAGVARVVAAMEDPDPRVTGRGLAMLRAAGITTTCGLLEAEARALNRGFLSRVQRGRPWLSLKLAASLDGRTAAASGESQWITGDAARRDVHRLRAEAGAVLSTAATVLADNPRLTVREGDCPRQPDRIVFDSRARVSADAAVWADDGARRFWVSCVPTPPVADVERLLVGRDAAGQMDLQASLAALAQAGVNSLLVESGPVFAGALLDAELVDELLLYLAPCLLGHAAPGLAQLTGRSRLSERLALDIQDLRRVGSDLRISARPVLGPHTLGPHTLGPHKET